MDLSSYIRDIPDFPKPGITFKDITPLLLDSRAFGESLDVMEKFYTDKEVDLVVSVESRGFVFGSPLADRLNAGFVPVRKPGKLPYKTLDVCYDLEYGSDALSIHLDSIREGQKVVIVDDVLATGGTVGAVLDLLGSLKADIVGALFLLELTGLAGRSKLSGYQVDTVLTY